MEELQDQSTLEAEYSRVSWFNKFDSLKSLMLLGLFSWLENYSKRLINVSISLFSSSWAIKPSIQRLGMASNPKLAPSMAPKIAPR